MNIFISYSAKDLSLVKLIESKLVLYGDVKYWDKNKQIGEMDWNQIFNWIDDADIILPIITDNVVSRAMSVGNEIGHAIKQDKFIIPIVTNNVHESELGCLKGITYQRIDPKNPWLALQNIETKIESEKSKEDFWNLVFIVGLVILAIWISSQSN